MKGQARPLYSDVVFISLIYCLALSFQKCDWSIVNNFSSGWKLLHKEDRKQMNVLGNSQSYLEYWENGVESGLEIYKRIFKDK